MEVPALEQRPLTPSAEGTEESMEPFIKINTQPLCQWTIYKLLSNLPCVGCIFINLILSTATSLDYSSGFMSVFLHVSSPFQATGKI